MTIQPVGALYVQKSYLYVASYPKGRCKDRYFH